MAKKILVVDDDELVLLTLKRLLKRVGYESIIAKDGIEAIKVIERIKRKSYDLIITDIRMPELNGIETIERIREFLRTTQRNPIPELVITAYDTEENLKKVRELKVAGLLIKPFDTQEFLCYVEECLKKKEVITKELPYRVERKIDRIITASYLPERIVANEEIVKNTDIRPTALQRSFGAFERRAAASDETGADMMAKVAKEILEKAGCSPEDIDCIICSADPADAAEPATASVVQAKIGASCPAFDVAMSCAGWIASMEIGLNYLARGKKKILVLASCTIGSRIFYRDLKHRAIFGDGAGGILLESQHQNRFLAIDLWTDGKHYSKIFVPHSWTILPKDIPLEYKNSFYMLSDQKEFFGVMDTHLAPFTENLFKKAKINMTDISLFLVHYPTKPLFEHSLRLLRIPREKTFHRFNKYGNIATAEMPVLLDEAIRSGRIKKGDLICILVYGAGFTGGGLIMQH